MALIVHLTRHAGGRRVAVRLEAFDFDAGQHEVAGALRDQQDRKGEHLVFLRLVSHRPRPPPPPSSYLGRKRPFPPSADQPRLGACLELVVELQRLGNRLRVFLSHLPPSRVLKHKRRRYPLPDCHATAEVVGLMRTAKHAEAGRVDEWCLRHLHRNRDRPSVSFFELLRDREDGSILVQESAMDRGAGEGLRA